VIGAQFRAKLRRFRQIALKYFPFINTLLHFGV
jgi:hypothetical protein